METRVADPLLALSLPERFKNVPQLFLSAHGPESEHWISSRETRSHW